MCIRDRQGVITHRYEVMARYADVIKSAAREELAKLKASRQDGNADCGWNKLHKVRRAIHRNEDILQPEQLEAVDKAIACLLYTSSSRARSGRSASRPDADPGPGAPGCGAGRR